MEESFDVFEVSCGRNINAEDESDFSDSLGIASSGKEDANDERDGTEKVFVLEK